MNKQKLINLLLIISSLFCYLEWADKSAFLFEVEYALFFKSAENLQSLVHPLIILPFIGQVLLLLAIFIKQNRTTFTYIGIAMLAVLVCMIFIVGIFSLRINIIISTVPFILLSFIAIVYNGKSKRAKL